MRIVKTELLWSRSCPLACAGCAMPNALRLDRRETPHAGTPEQWADGMAWLRSTGCEFVAIYGAEPVTRVAGLRELVAAIYKFGMKATLITAYPDAAIVESLLRTTPLDSLTMSFEVNSEDPDRQEKMRRAQIALDRPALREVPDRAVVMTLTEGNVWAVPDVVRTMSPAGVWTLFDLLHRSGGPLSKCGHDGPMRPPDMISMRAVAAELRGLKAQGLKVHASDEYLRLLHHAYNGEPRDLWHCEHRAAGWLTVDADGTLLACDDHQQRAPWKIWEHPDAGDVELWLEGARPACVGCAWNTHVDAVNIAEGASLGTYIHGNIA